MRDSGLDIAPYRIAIITLDAHNARPCERALAAMAGDFPGLQVDIFAAAQWGEDPKSFDAAKQAI